MTKKGAIWWSVDPFNDDIRFHKKELAALLPLARALSTEIQPVTFIDIFRSLGREGNVFPLMPLYSDNYDEIKNEASKRLKSLYTTANKSLLRETKFLTHDPLNAPSLQQRVEVIIKAAVKASAAFVALRTHSRKGIQRLYMGSFAETFLLYTSIPTLVFRSDTHVSSSWKKAIFPTDFSAESKSALLKLMPLFLKMKTSLIIAHVNLDFMSYRLKSSDDMAARHSHEKYLRQLGERFVGLAQKRKVKAKFELINPGINGDSTDALIKLSKNSKADIIALAAKSSPLKTALVGALTRKIVRNSYCPVLIHRIK